MEARKMFNWTVSLSNGDNEHVEAFWSPEHEGTREAVGVAGVAQAWLRAGKPIEATHVSQWAVPVAVTLDE